MKIKLTEEQYRKFVLENTNRTNFMNKVYKEIEEKDIGDVFPLIVDTYGFTVNEVLEDEMLYHLIGYKLLDTMKNFRYLGFNPRPYIRYINAIAEKLSDDVFESNIPPPQKSIELNQILYLFDDSVAGNETAARALMSIEPSIEYLFKNNPPKKAIKLISNLYDKVRGRGFDNEIMDKINDFASKQGFTLFDKTAGLTFEKRDGMIQSLINYITDKPKKTKEGFLRYINSRGRTSGQHSTFFRAAVASGIIKKVRDGRTITYELGPNYEAWKNGNLLAF